VDAQIGMGEALLNQDEPNQALDYFLSASRLDPAGATVHYQLACSIASSDAALIPSLVRGAIVEQVRDSPARGLESPPELPQYTTGSSCSPLGICNRTSLLYPCGPECEGGLSCGHQGPQPQRPLGSAELSQRLGFDLPDPALRRNT
jgi:hypothetical protein